MPDLAARVRRGYGADPLHLLALLACFALAGYVAVHLVHEPTLIRMLIWFAGAVVGHDLVLFPLYALGDRSLRAALHTLWPRGPATPSLVPPLNYLRVPALGTGLLFLMFFPGIIRQGQQTYLAATGQNQQPYLARWLLLTAAMFAVSAVSYALRLRQAHASRRAGAKAALR
jgi:hypothetical protein